MRNRLASLLLFAVLAAGAWLARSASCGPERGAPGSTSAAPKSASEITDAALEVPEPLGTAASERAPAAPERAAPEASAVAGAALSGTLVFLDGVAAPAITLVALTAAERDVRPAPAGAPRVVTDADGRFGFAALTPGEVFLRPERCDGRMLMTRKLEVTEALQVPARDVTVRLPVLRIQVELRGPGGQPAPRLPIRFELVPDGETSRPSAWNLQSDDAGRATDFVPSIGTARFTAYADEGRARADLADVRIEPGISARVIHLVAQPLPATAALRVRLVCASPGLKRSYDSRGNLRIPESVEPYRFQPFLAQLDDAETGLNLRTLDSDDVQGDGAIYGLAPGRYEVTLHDRLRDPIGLYGLDHGRGCTVDLVADERTDALFLVECGGRLALTLTGGPGRSRVFLVDPEDRGGGAEKRIDFAEVTDGGWSVGVTMPHGRRMISERLLAPGRYVLRIETAQLPDRRVDVEIFAGRVTELVVDLDG
jgi:hypothetical protein